MERTLTFRSRRPDPATGRSCFRGVLRNADAPVGRVAAQLAQRLGIAGNYEIISQKRGVTVDPSSTLAELEEDEFVISPEYTPA
jgi:hypothetical protein